MSTLFLTHYHFRPGGVRKVIENALSCWKLGHRWEKIVLVCGEIPDSAWRSRIRKKLPDVEIAWEIIERASYLQVQNPEFLRAEELENEVLSVMKRYQPTMVWAHNLSVGRNVLFGRAIFVACQKEQVPLLCHHHDWWVDGRWDRWPEMKRWRIGNFAEAARGTIPEGLFVRHACVHPFDATILQKHFGNRAALISQPPDAELPAISKAEMQTMRRVIGVAPYWLAPCRILRRKNLIEALVLLKLLWPEGRLLISGDASSTDEVEYAAAISEAAAMLKVEVQMNVAQQTGVTQATLLEGADVLFQTSTKEGFGLAATDAARLGKPILLRRLPGVTAMLEARGLAFPMSYFELKIPLSLAANFSGESTQNEISPPDDLLRAWGMGKWKGEASREASSDFGKLNFHQQIALLKLGAPFLEAVKICNPWLNEISGLLLCEPTRPKLADDFARKSASWVSEMERLLAGDSPVGDPVAALKELALIAR